MDVKREAGDFEPDADEQNWFDVSLQGNNPESNTYIKQEYDGYPCHAAEASFSKVFLFSLMVNILQ
jgi:hypothetical protein